MFENLFRKYEWSVPANLSYTLQSHWYLMFDLSISHYRRYSDVIMGVMTSQITSLTSVYSTVYSGTDQRKHQSSASLAFVRGIHRWPVNSPHKGPVTRKLFPFDDVIMGNDIGTNDCMNSLRKFLWVTWMVAIRIIRSGRRPNKYCFTRHLLSEYTGKLFYCILLFLSKSLLGKGLDNEGRYYMYTVFYYLFEYC